VLPGPSSERGGWFGAPTSHLIVVFVIVPWRPLLSRGGEPVRRVSPLQSRSRVWVGDPSRGSRDLVAAQLVGADHFEVLVDEDVVWPIDPDVVNLVFAVAQLHDPVDNSAGVGSQGRLGRLVGGCSAHDRA
jgi:hypothetical protein